MFPRTGLWRHADFMRLWAAQTFSAYGSRITRTALPIIAVSTLNQPEAIVSLLMALQLAPGIFVGLSSGGFIDRSRKRRILIAADLVRAIVVGSLTLAWFLGVLSMAHVIVVGALVGGASALFQITDVAYLPTLVRRDQLAEGNSKLESTEAIAEITGPASAGALIAALGAPLVVLIDAASYLWSALMLGRIRAVEDAPTPAQSASMSSTRPGHDLRVGLRAIFRHPIVRPIVISHMVWSISGGFFMALYTLFCLRELGLSETVFGIIVSMGGIGSLGGAIVSRRLVTSIGLGRALLLTSTLSLTCALLIPLAASPATGGSYLVVLLFLGAHQVLSDGFSVAFVIQAVTLRQTVLPKHVLGRANAAIHVFTSGLLPIGAILAGVIAELAGTYVAVWVGVLIGLAAPVFLLPLRSLREMPAGPSDHATADARTAA
ncbi:MAG TPA: MFS transporter [Kofleriaceae bacterium]|nr:MFS transporter [Kofleriaceae bacterium]